MTGEDFTYTIVVANAGPDDATGVSVVDTLPAGVAFVNASTGCVEAAGVVTCDVGDLANDGSVTLEIVVTAPATAGTITNEAEVAGNERDPDTTNNTDTEETVVELTEIIEVTRRSC